MKNYSFKPKILTLSVIVSMALFFVVFFQFTENQEISFPPWYATAVYGDEEDLHPTTDEAKHIPIWIKVIGLSTLFVLMFISAMYMGKRLKEESKKS